MGLALTLALTLGVGALQAETTPASTSTIDVVVQDARGRTSDTLGPSDFTVTEHSLPVTIDAVRFVRATGTPPGGLVPVKIASHADELAAVSETSRLFAIFLDEFHVTPGPSAERARAALIRFIREDLGPGDLFVVLKPLDSLLDIRLTNDRDAAVRAIESFDPRRGDYAPRTTFERNFIAGAPARIDSARAQIAASSLDALATHLGRFNPARKTLIIVSEGFLRGTRRRGDEQLPTADSVVIAANRARVSIYPIDPLAGDTTDPIGPVAPADGPTRDPGMDGRMRDALRALGDGTAGRALTTADDVSAGLKQALSDASGYYVLTLSHPQTRRDGRFHAVDVAVRRPELTLRARPGYWSPSDEDAAPPRPTSLSSQFASQFVRRTSPLIRAWFGMSRGIDGGTRVSFVWEPAPRVPGDRRTTPAPARIALTVTTLDGHPIFDGVVMPSNRAVADPSASQQSRAAFEIPAGRLLIQMAIEDAGSRVLDRDVRDLVVGGFPGPVAIGSAEVLRARTAREFRMLAADPSSTPVASRQFSRAERLLVRVPVYSTGAQAVLSARLVSSLGARMRDLTVVPSPSPLAPFQIDVPLAALPAGAYSLELTARTPDGEARDSVPFRVTP